LIQQQFINFEFNKRAQTSEALIDYVAAQTGKNKVLIASDLSSVFEDVRQYANIGKAFAFAGLGNISLNRSGEYEFSAGTVPVQTADAGYSTRPETETAGKGQAGRNAVILIAFLIILLVAGGLGWGIYKYIKQKKDTVTALEPGGAPDSTKTVQSHSDSTASPARQATLNTTAADTAEYKFIFETTSSSMRAYRRYDSLVKWKENCLLDSIKHDTSTLYHLYVKIKVAAADTARVKDSLQKYYSRPYPVVIQRK